jgi:hypothetical protein
MSVDKFSFTLPSYQDIHSHRRGHRYGYWKFYEALNQWAQFNTRGLQKIVAKQPLDGHYEELQQIHKHALEVFITEYSGWATLTIISEKEPVRNLEDLEKRLKEVSISASSGGGNGPIRHTVASDIFMELSRTHFILMHQQLLDESARINRLSELPEARLYRVLWSLEHASFFTGNSKPIMSYKQSEIMALLFHVTEHLDYLPINAVEELRHILLLLYTRNSIFFCERTHSDVLDLPGAVDNVPSRDYMIFCSIYFHTIQRRLYFYDTCTRRKLVPPLGRSTARIALFIEHEIKLGEENFEEEYKKACEEAYEFPGDLEWFKYENPDVPPQTGPILDCYRKELAKKYYTTYRATQDVVLAAVQQPTQSGHAARCFVLNLFDQYMRIHHKIPWKDAIVIKNSAIERNEKKLFSKKSAPFLVQVVSRFWVYCNRVVYMTDNLYEAIAYWLHLLREHYGGKLFGVDLNGLIGKLLTL